MGFRFTAAASFVVLSAAGLVACADLSASGRCASDPGACDGGEDTANGFDSGADTALDLDVAGDGPEDTTFPTDGAKDEGSDVAVPDAVPDACAAAGACIPGSTRIGGKCAIDEIGTEKCSPGCAWETTCAPRKGWRTIATPPTGFRGRRFGAVAWTGSQMVIVGGETSTGYALDAASYEYATDTWKALPGLPSGMEARRSASAVWTGSEVVVWGGLTPMDYVGDGATFDPVTNTWKKIAASPLAARGQHGAVWATTTKQILVWGGRGKCTGIVCDDGAAYDPATDTWSMLPAAPLTPRDEHFVAWTGSELLVWGGNAGDTFYRDGARYNPSTKAWTKLPDPPTTITGHLGMVTVFVGGEFYVWGGENKIDTTNNGARYVFSSNAWNTLALPVSTLLKPRSLAHGWFGNGQLFVWAGSESLGTSGAVTVSGGAAYSPTSDAWLAVDNSGQPSARVFADVVWTGRAAIVWGGQAPGAFLGDGAAFIP
ncbi:MAG: hypothetical protein HYV09_24835 [Deltaproteobacteria bacterium]|nr:hypothetical protein [Deltaproteobacteria bacterium]